MNMETRRLHPEHLRQSEEREPFHTPEGSTPLFAPDTGQVSPFVAETPSGNSAPAIPLGGEAAPSIRSYGTGKMAPISRIQELVAEITRFLPEVERLIAHTSYGPEALKRARNNIERAQQLLAAGKTTTTEISPALQDLERTHTMFQNILSRLKGA